MLPSLSLKSIFRLYQWSPAPQIWISLKVWTSSIPIVTRFSISYFNYFLTHWDTLVSPIITYGLLNSISREKHTGAGTSLLQCVLTFFFSERLHSPHPHLKGPCKTEASSLSDKLCPIPEPQRKASEGWVTVAPWLSPYLHNNALSLRKTEHMKSLRRVSMITLRTSVGDIAQPQGHLSLCKKRD